MSQPTWDELRQTVNAETRYCPICDETLTFDPCPACRGTGVNIFIYTKHTVEELEGLPYTCGTCMGLEGNWDCPTHGPVIVMFPESGECVRIETEAQLEAMRLDDDSNCRIRL